MTHVSEHDTEKEWERDAGKHSWVSFLVHGDTIGVDDLLEGSSEFISFEIGGGSDCMIVKSFKVGCGVLRKSLSNLFFISNGGPEESNVGSSTLSHVVE